MTVRLLSDRPPYKAGNIVTFDAATETGLVAAKEASTDLTGGTTPTPALPATVPTDLTMAELAAVRGVVSTHGITSAGLRTVLFGHSYIDQEAGGSSTITSDTADSWLTTGTVQWANWLLGKPLQIVKEFGYGSRRILDMMPRYAAEVAPLLPQVLFVSIGHNDLKGLYVGGGDQTAADVRQKQVPYLLQRIREWLRDDVAMNTTVFIMAETPMGTNGTTGAAGAAEIKWLGLRFKAFNDGMRALCHEFGNLVYVPLDRVTIDPASLSFDHKSGHYWDTTHPGIVGAYSRGMMLADYIERSLPLHCDSLCASAADTFSNTKITVTTASALTFNGTSVVLPFANVYTDWRYVEVGDMVTLRITSPATDAEKLLNGRYPVIAADDVGCTIACDKVGTIPSGRVVVVSPARQMLINPLFTTTTGGQQSPSGVVGVITGTMPLGATVINLPATMAITVSSEAHTQRDGSAGFGNWMVLDITSTAGAGVPVTCYIKLPASAATASPATYDVERKAMMGQTFKFGAEVRQESAAAGYFGCYLEMYGVVVDAVGGANAAYWKAYDLLRDTTNTPVSANFPWPMADMTLTAETPEMTIGEDPATRIVSSIDGRIHVNFLGSGSVKLKIGRATLSVVDDPVEDLHIGLK